MLNILHTHIYNLPSTNIKKLKSGQWKKLWERHKTIINSLAEEVLGIMEPADKGTWFDAECQAATEDKIKAYRKMQQGHGTRSIIDEYKEKRKKNG